MTNIFGEPKKMATKQDLFQFAIDALERNGWKVERIPGIGKSSVRRIVKGSEKKAVSIRTSQDTWIAFPRNRAGNGWGTLADVDYVVAASVDDRENPQFAQVHMIDGEEMRGRFDRAYAARKKAGHSLQQGRGIWLSLYREEEENPVNLVGAGAGLTNPPIARVPLKNDRVANSEPPEEVKSGDHSAIALNSSMPHVAENIRLSIPEAKRLLAISFGVNEGDIKITISS